MTRKEFHTAFNVQLDKSEAISHPAFLSKEKDFWINTAIRNLVKTKYSGTNPLRKAFQQDQKRTDDLRTVVTTKTYVKDTDYVQEGNLIVLDYPTTVGKEYWFTVGENVRILPKDTTNWPYYTIDQNNVKTYIGREVDITECTIENITSRINSVLSEYHMRNNYARPLRWISDGSIFIYKDSDYDVISYDLVYVFKPEVFTRTNENEDDVYLGLPEHMHDEIVAYAVRLALGSIGDERYQTQSAENQIIE